MFLIQWGHTNASGTVVPADWFLFLDRNFILSQQRIMKTSKGACEQRILNAPNAVFTIHKSIYMDQNKATLNKEPHLSSIYQKQSIK